MSSMHRTTIYLDGGLHERIRALAAAEGATQAEIIRKALLAYAAGSERPPRSIGLGASGREDLSERAEDLLAGMGEDP